jgi:hypothetical protein
LLLLAALSVLNAIGHERTERVPLPTPTTPISEFVIVVADAGTTPKPAASSEGTPDGPVKKHSNVRIAAVTMAPETMPQIAQLDLQIEVKILNLPPQVKISNCPGSMPTPPTTNFEITENAEKGSEHKVFETTQVEGSPGCVHGPALPHE